MVYKVRNLNISTVFIVNWLLPIVNWMSSLTYWDVNIYIKL